MKSLTQGTEAESVEQRISVHEWLRSFSPIDKTLLRKAVIERRGGKLKKMKKIMSNHGVGENIVRLNSLGGFPLPAEQKAKGYQGTSLVPRE